MRIGDLAARADVTVKAVRYYERLGLVTPARRANGYREYSEADLRAVREIRDLASAGISPRLARPFIDCLSIGHEHGDDCISSLAVYRRSITELDHLIADLTDRRDRLSERLTAGAARTFTPESRLTAPAPDTDPTALPADLPAPHDDGRAAHLPGLTVPMVRLQSTDGAVVDLADLGPERTIIYLYPLTGRPDVDLPEGWDAIPGARGCTTEACDFRDHLTDLHAAGASAVYGLSSQDSAYQAEVRDRLRLPFQMLSDPEFALQRALALPTFDAPGRGRLYSRLTLVVRNGRIEHTFYPVFPPNTHAQQVLVWLTDNPLHR